MSILICGSIAYDNIMVFPERFKDHILPEKTHMLNVAFLVPELHRNFGGTAGNIAYNLKKLGAEPLPMATVGSDFDDYRDHLDALGIRLDHVRGLDQHWTAQAYITTDLDDNQITAFHPGAMNEAHVQRVPTDGSVKFGIVAPDGKQAMIEHSEQFAAADIPHIFDPGQGLPMFDGEELQRFVGNADWLVVNSYEWEMVKHKTGWSQDDITRQLDGGLVITQGGDGSELYDASGKTRIPAVKPEKIADPTGCGDAYRAGMLYGLERGWEAADACRLGSILGALKIAHNAPQHHDFDIEQVKQRFESEFGKPMPG